MNLLRKGLWRVYKIKWVFVCAIMLIIDDDDDDKNYIVGNCCII